MNKPKWNEEENLQIIIKDNGTARATTWARYYYSDEKLPTATVQGVHFDTDQTKAVNALVETSVKQTEQEMMKKVEDWFTNAPKYRTKKRLLSSLQDTNLK